MINYFFKIIFKVIFLLFFLNNCSYAKTGESKLSFASTINKVSPAVVSVYSSNILSKQSFQLSSSNYTRFLEKNLNNCSSSLGSGVIVSYDGLIVTNAHVVDQRNNITIILQDGREYKAKKLATNTSIDLALLKIIPKTHQEVFNFLEIKCENDNTQVGDIVLAIGNPFGIGQTVTYGIVSGFRYFEKGEDFGFGKLIQIDATIYPGNSGGALINSLGELIGINSNIFAYNNSSSGIGFAIPSSVVRLFITRYLSGGSLKKYWIGLVGVTVDASIADKLGLNLPSGVYVDNIMNDGPSDIANIKKGDVIIKFNDTPINTISDLSFAIAKIEVPNKIFIKIIRNNKVIDTVLIPEIPKEEPKKNLYYVKEGVLKGTVFANNSPLVSYEINSDLTQQGVVIYELAPNSLLRKLGIEIGDFITKIGNTYITDTKILKSYLEKNNTSKYSMVLRRRNQILNLNINR